VNRAAISAAAVKRGGVTPFNVLPMPNGSSVNGAGAFGHGAGTPEPLCDWWIRYISPPDSVVCDPFIGSGTVGLAALKRGRSIIGIERDPGYFAIAEKRIAEARAKTALLDPVA
jgi:DNA modification methylase